MSRYSWQHIAVTCGLLVLAIGCPVWAFPIMLYYFYCTFFQSEDQCKSIAGEVAVVTGSGHGLGKEIALQLAQHGCHVAIVDVNAETALETARYITEHYNVRCKAYTVDVSNYEQVLELSKSVSSDLGDVTILVNNAGLILFEDLENPKIAEIQRMINVNLTAHFVTNSVFLPKMKELNKGHIVAISSLAAYVFGPLLGPYSSTKFGVRALMSSLHAELRMQNYNVHTTTIYPNALTTNTEAVDFLNCIEFDRMTVNPLITGEQAAGRVLKAILRNEPEAFIPDHNLFLAKMLGIAPLGLVVWIITKVLKVDTKLDNYRRLKQRT